MNKKKPLLISYSNNRFFFFLTKRKFRIFLHLFVDFKELDYEDDRVLCSTAAI